MTITPVNVGDEEVATGPAIGHKRVCVVGEILFWHGVSLLRLIHHLTTFVFVGLALEPFGVRDVVVIPFRMLENRLPPAKSLG